MAGSGVAAGVAGEASPAMPVVRADVRRVDAWPAAALLSGLGALAVYRMTLLPGLGAWDTGEAQTVLPILGTMHPTGSPAYVVLGWLTALILRPLGEPAFLVNLLSALLVACAVGTSVLVHRRLGATIPVAIAVAAGLALTPIVWRVAVAADVHALHLALLVAVVALLLRWEALVRDAAEAPGDRRRRVRADRAIVVTAAVFGIAVANHALSLLLLPAIGLYVLAVEPRVLLRPKVVVAAIGACLGVAALLYLELPLRAGPLRAPLVYGHPETWTGFWDVVLARQFQGDIAGPLANLPDKVGNLLDLASAQLGPLLVLVPAGLLVTAVRYPRYALLSLVATATTCFFAASYANAAIERYYLGPVFFAWTWLGVFLATIVDRVAQPARDDAADAAFVPGSAPVEEPAPVEEAVEPASDPSPLAGPPPRLAAPAAGRPVAARPWIAASALVGVALGLAVLAPTATSFGARWREMDRSNDTWVHGWLDDAFSSLEPSAVVVSWWSYSTPLWYGQLVEGRRPDIWIVDDRTRLDLGLGELSDVIEANIDHRPVYLIRLQQSEIKALTDRYVIEPVGRPGNLYRVTGRRQETSP